jgi:hypothetical protein
MGLERVTARHQSRLEPDRAWMQFEAARGGVIDEPTPPPRDLRKEEAAGGGGWGPAPAHGHDAFGGAGRGHGTVITPHSALVCIRRLGMRGSRRRPRMTAVSQHRTRLGGTAARPPRRCTIDRRAGLSAAAFGAEYAARNRPAILRGAIDDWPAWRSFTRAGLLRGYGGERLTVRLSSDALYDQLQVARDPNYDAALVSRDPRNVTLREYVEVRWSGSHDSQGYGPMTEHPGRRPVGLGPQFGLPRGPRAEPNQTCTGVARIKRKSSPGLRGDEEQCPASLGAGAGRCMPYIVCFQTCAE